MEDVSSGAVLVAEERTAMGDYWELLNIAHKLSWTGKFLRLSSNSKSLLHPKNWCITPPDAHHPR